MDTWRGGLGFGYHGMTEGRSGLLGNKLESDRKVCKTEKIEVIVVDRLWPSGKGRG